MCVPTSSRWAQALQRTLSRVYDATTRTPVPWFLSGDAALSVQGVAIDPEVIEFRAISQYATAYFAQFMKPYEPSPNAATIVYRRGGNLAPSDNWRSNLHQRIVAWSGGGRASWLGRWMVDGVAVQVSYLRSIHADPVTLASAAPVKRVHFDGLEVPVVPLECLLAGSALRSEAQLTHRILHTMRDSGYDPELLRQSLDVLPADRALRLMRLLDLNLIAG